MSKMFSRRINTSKITFICVFSLIIPGFPRSSLLADLIPPAPDCHIWENLGNRILECVDDTKILIDKKYNRKSWKHWIDQDKDCQNTRIEVLIEESIGPPILDETDCKVISGVWEDPYTGRQFKNPSHLDIDHTIPLKLAFESGGMFWDKEKRKSYANFMAEPDHLIAIEARVNRSKGANPIHIWHPKESRRRCWYAQTYLKIKRQWELTFTAHEVVGLILELEQCSR
jgi:hypothetical protein